MGEPRQDVPPHVLQYVLHRLAVLWRGLGEQLADPVWLQVRRPHRVLVHVAVVLGEEVQDGA